MGLAPASDDSIPERAFGVPGSELDGLYSFQTAGEVLKLLARLFAYTASTPGALVRGEADESADGPTPSTLSYTRVTLDA